MPLLFTSLLAAGAGVVPPDPPFVWTTNLLYRFSASEAVFADNAGLVPVADLDPVARWGNLGSAEDAQQSDPAHRPLWRSDGLGGHPYIACDCSLAQCFEDLDFAQPAGSTGSAPFTVFAVTDAVAELSLLPALLGAPVSSGGKVSLHFRDTAGAQIHWIKSQMRAGNVTNPQLLMAAAGRNASGDTNLPYANFWLRQNRIGLWIEDRQLSNLSSTALASTQFLRSSGFSSGGYFHGHLYEVLLYEGTLDDTTTFAIEDWLAQRYGLL
ncbi:hypothetical protein M8756_16770 [Lutimaribacter sp. EGI FJ00015]|uniref:Uncharacterized protein n=1 Tax=Lutimaribacter degradans TaxID=2945989 RepID=A0ACC5ZZJ6_9RHOB|nr:hypothetical protein [Lutimaribacter sp. EGI FJ00013]MCM2563779.1 hypothetical protein [Lutimaribacter sp. EGI FJ00013]MCO0614966.1 hypothetical protein [Lutimaribacter sp. EGI FJ00015]MCO0637642.1 hypothetical protein [Lutimaribacter sp. EGI FJ00014]